MDLQIVFISEISKGLDPEAAFLMSRHNKQIFFWKAGWNVLSTHTEVQTHSSHCRSLVSLTRSLKQPKECMLSRTSGSRSVRDRILFTHTRLGGGCSGHGSFLPPLRQKDTQQHKKRKSDFIGIVLWNEEKTWTISGSYGLHTILHNFKEDPNLRCYFCF